MLSVTTLCTYLYCPRKLYLTKVLGLIEPPKEVAVLGSLRHAVYDKINKIEKEIICSINEPNEELIIKLYKKEYAKALRTTIINFKPNLEKVNLNLAETFKTIWPFLEKEYTFRTDNILEFINEEKVLGQELWEKLTPKIESEVRVESQTLELKGIVDRVEIYKGNIIPAELKTGKAPTDTLWKGHKIQLVAYILLLEEKYGMEIKGGYVHYLNEDVKFDIIMNPFLKDEIIQLTNKVKDLLDSSEVPDPLYKSKKCDICNLRKDCFDYHLINQKTENQE